MKKGDEGRKDVKKERKERGKDVKEGMLLRKDIKEGRI